MKQIIVLLLFFVFFGCKKTTNTNRTFSTTALSETLLDTNGHQVLFSDILEKQKGKNTVIEVWASWCGDCIQAMPKIKALQLAHPEINFVFISMDKSVESWQNGITKHELKGSQFMAKDQMEGKFAKSIDLDWIPRYIIIDKTGKIIIYRAIETEFDLIIKTISKLK